MSEQLLLLLFVIVLATVSVTAQDVLFDVVVCFTRTFALVGFVLSKKKYIYIYIRPIPGRCGRNAKMRRIPRFAEKALIVRYKIYLMYLRSTNISQGIRGTRLPPYGIQVILHFYDFVLCYIIIYIRIWKPKKTSEEQTNKITT